MVMLTPRRLLLPDENVSWLVTAIPAARRLVRREGIDMVLTTSPPGSVHLVGFIVRRLTGARWVADLRDSLIAKSDRRYERRAVRVKEGANLLLARLVSRSADAIVAATETIAAEARATGARSTVVVIPNGCDFDDFDGLAHHPNERFRITHTGSFLGERTARPILDVVARVDPAVVVRFVGDFPRAELEWAKRHGLESRVELTGRVTRRRALELQRDSEALLLLLQNSAQRNHDVPSGKLFEYLAAERPILAVVPPDGTAATLINATRMGKVVAPGDTAALGAAIQKLVQEWRANPSLGPVLSTEWKERLSREGRVRELISILSRVHASGRQHK
jgi:glycosyltransferase involved in cell wall biosynthesis